MVFLVLHLRKQQQDKNVELVYMNWDSEVASINVLSQAMEQHGFDIKKTALDNTVAWQTVQQMVKLTVWFLLGSQTLMKHNGKSSASPLNYLALTLKELKLVLSYQAT